MSEQLRAAMSRLADESVPAPVPPDTWRRARRARRRDGVLTGLAAVVALTLLAFSATSLVSGLTRPPVASQDAPGALPDQVWVPGPTESALEEGDAFDSVALLSFVSGQRSPAEGDSPQPFVLGATNGEYRYLDLPGLLPAQGAVSADGSTVVWPVSGDDGDVVGQALRVWEPETGAVHDVDLGPGAEPVGQVYVSADGSLATAAQDGAALVVDVATGAVVDRRVQSVPVGWTASDEALLVERARLRAWTESGPVRVLGPWSGEPAPVVPSPAGSYLVPTPDGTGLVVVGGSGERRRLPLPAAGPVRGTAVGWVDDRTVVMANQGGGALGREAGLVTVDVRTGEVDPWVQVPQVLVTDGRLLVTSALAGIPPYEATDPGGTGLVGWPTLALIISLLLVVVAGRALINWRWPDPPEADLSGMHLQQGVG